MRSSPFWLSPWGAKWAFLLISLAAVSAKELCQSELKPNLDELIEFAVKDKEKLNLKEFKIVLKEGDDFNHILTPPCDPLKFPVLSVEFREEGTDDWHESKIGGISNHKRSDSKLIKNRKAGKIKLKNIEDKTLELNYCKVYEMRLKVNENSGAQVIKVGPFKDTFTRDELANLDEEQEDGEKEINLTYEKTENSVKVSWNDICAQSVKIWLKTGDGKDAQLIKTKTDLSEHSFTIETKPCHFYEFELDFFLAPDPDEKSHSYGTFYKGINPYISPPDPETFANIRIDESSKELSWDFGEYRGFSPDKALCIKKNGLKYKITFGTIDGKDPTVLKEEDSPVANQPYNFDVLGEIPKKNIKLEKCGQYEVKMEVSYITAMGENLSRVFKEPFNTNHDGTLEKKEEDDNEMTDNGDELDIKFGSCKKENTEVVLVDMGDNLVQGKIAGGQLGQPRIISSKEVTIENPKVSMTELKTSEELQPCVSYSIQLVTQEQKDELLQTILDNNHISNLADPIDIDIRAPWGKPTLTQEGSNLKVQDTENNNRCHKEAYKIKCWESAENESLAEETIHPPQDINIVDLNYTTGSEYICRAKIEYKAQGGDQTPFETDWSEAYTFTVPDPTTEPPPTKPPPTITVDNIVPEDVPNVEAPIPDDGTVDAPNPNAPDASPKKSSPVGAIVGVVLVLLVVALAGVAFFMYRKKNASAGGGDKDQNLSPRASATKSETTVEMGPSPMANADVKPEENESLLTGPKADGTTAEASPAPDVPAVAVID